MQKKLAYLLVTSVLMSCSLKNEQLIHAQQPVMPKPIVSIEQKVDQNTGDPYFAYCSGNDCPVRTEKIASIDSAATAVNYDNEPSQIRKNIEIKTVKISEVKPLSLQLDHELKSIKENISFTANNERLGPNGILAISALLPTAMSADRIFIRGRTDASGNKSNNVLLARKRAAEVSQAMINAGVEAEKITQTYCTVCFVSSNDTAESRAANRRVEIELLTKK